MKKRLVGQTMALLWLAFMVVPVFGALERENLTLTFDRAKLSRVLDTLSRETGIKFIYHAELGERPVSAYLDDVPGPEAVDAILQANDLYREKIPGSDIYRVRETPERQEVPPSLEQETIFLQYAKAVDLREVLAPLLSERGQVIVDERTNSISVRESSGSLRELRNIITVLDRPIPQVSIEAVLVEITADSLKDLGIRWNMGAEFFGAAKDVPTPFRDRDVNLDIVGPGTGATGTVAVAPQFIMGRLSFQALTANLRLMEEKGEANILANPRITTLNDAPATIRITRNMAIAPRVTESPEAGRFVTEYEYRDVGVILTVTPTINEQGDITLDIEPSVSSARRSTVFEDAVDTDERTAKTKVMVHDGETIVIGGLLRESTVSRRSKVPLLGDVLPFLFSRKDDRVEKTDLVIFISPTIITRERAQTFSEQERERLGIESKSPDDED